MGLGGGGGGGRGRRRRLLLLLLLMHEMELALRRVMGRRRGRVVGRGSSTVGTLVRGGQGLGPPHVRAMLGRRLVGVLDRLVRHLVRGRVRVLRLLRRLRVGRVLRPVGVLVARRAAGFGGELGWWSSALWMRGVSVMKILMRRRRGRTVLPTAPGRAGGGRPRGRSHPPSTPAVPSDVGMLLHPSVPVVEPIVAIHGMAVGSSGHGRAVRAGVHGTHILRGTVLGHVARGILRLRGAEGVIWWVMWGSLLMT